MDMFVVLELCIRQQFVPVVLPLITEQVQVLLQLLVDLFGLPIRLGVVCSGGMQLHTEEVVQLLR